MNCHNVTTVDDVVAHMRRHFVKRSDHESQDIS